MIEWLACSLWCVLNLEEDGPNANILTTNNIKNVFYSNSKNHTYSIFKVIFNLGLIVKRAKLISTGIPKHAFFDRIVFSKVQYIIDLGLSGGGGGVAEE